MSIPPHCTPFRLKLASSAPKKKEICYPIRIDHGFGQHIAIQRVNSVSSQITIIPGILLLWIIRPTLLILQNRRVNHRILLRRVSPITLLILSHILRRSSVSRVLRLLTRTHHCALSVWSLQCRSSRLVCLFLRFQTLLVTDMFRKVCDDFLLCCI